MQSFIIRFKRHEITLSVAVEVSKACWTLLGICHLWAVTVHGCAADCEPYFVLVCLFLLLSILFCIGFRWTVWRLDNHVLYKAFPPYHSARLALSIVNSYHDIIDCLPHAVLYIPRTIPKLPICTSKSLHLFHPVSPRPLAIISLFSVSVSILFVLFFRFEI